jgi:hypothetical protein
VADVTGRSLSEVIAHAVNQHYGYDLFDAALGEAVVAALTESGYEIAPANSEANYPTVTDDT